VEDPLELHTQFIQRPQLRQLLEQRFQLRFLLRTQARRIAAKLPHPRPKLLALRLRQFLLVAPRDFFFAYHQRLHQTTSRHGTDQSTPWRFSISPHTLYGRTLPCPHDNVPHPRAAQASTNSSTPRLLSRRGPASLPALEDSADHSDRS